MDKNTFEKVSGAATPQEAVLLMVTEADRVEVLAVGFCQRRIRSTSIIQHAFPFMN
jgi:hypothetical protein